MTEKTQKFIEDYLDLIDQNRWDEIQPKAYVILGDLYHEFNAVMLNAGINPMIDLSMIPWTSMQYCPVEEYDIPSSVKIIGGRAFEYAGFPEITIPEGVEIINFRAFAECPRLHTVYLPSTIKKLDSAIFMHCLKLEKIVYNGSSREFENIQKSVADSPFTWYTVAADLKRVNCRVVCSDKNILIGAFGK